MPDLTPSPSPAPSPAPTPSPSPAPTPSPSPAPTPSGFTWAREDGAFSEGWLDKLPDGLGANPSLRVIGSVGDLAKSYVETKKLIGTKLEMPGEGATPEQVAAWRKTVGAPEKPEGYLGEAKSLRPDAIPENVWNAESEKQFLAIAHKHHLPPAAVKEILGFYGQSIANELQAAQQTEKQTLESEKATLQKAWGQEFDTNLNLAQRMAVTLGLDPKSEAMFTSAKVVQAFAQMGKLISEDKLVKGDAASGIGGSIRDKIHEITSPGSTSSLARDYRGENGPERQQAAQAQLHQLYAAAGQS